MEIWAGLKLTKSLLQLKAKSETECENKGPACVRLRTCCVAYQGASRQGPPSPTDWLLTTYVWACS